MRKTGLGTQRQRWFRALRSRIPLLSRRLFACFFVGGANAKTPPLFFARVGVGSGSGTMVAGTSNRRNLSLGVEHEQTSAIGSAEAMQGTMVAGASNRRNLPELRCAI